MIEIAKKLKGYNKREKTICMRIQKAFEGIFEQDTVLEWSGETKAVNHHDFKWTDNVVGELTGVTIARISVATTHDAYIALAETKEDRPKNITVCLGGWNNSESGVNYIENGTGNFGGAWNDRTRATVLGGMDTPKWFEFDWTSESEIKIF